MYVAPESKLLVNLANVTTASVEEELPKMFGGACL